jgi:replicative DNA helicase
MAEYKVRIFYSYSHKDEMLRASLETHLSIMKRQGIIEEWYDRKVIPGTDWETEISANLEAADIVLLLVSPDFVASDYCYGRELRRALERYELGQARIVPIVIRPVDWQHALFRHFQALPQDGKPVTGWANADEAWLDITLGLRKVVEEVVAERSVVSEQRGPTLISEAVMQEVKRIESSYRRKGPIGGFPTGFDELDSLVDGIHGSDVVVVAGRPLMGMTDFVLNVASHAAITKSVSVMIFSLRSPPKLLTSRLLASEAEIPLDRILRGTLSNSDWVALARAADELYKAPILVDSGATVEDCFLEGCIEKAKHTNELGLVIVDGLEHVIASKKNVNDATDATSIIRTIKLIARKYNIPLILTLSTVREADRRMDKRPRISDLGEWEALATDVADVVILLYRDEVYNSDVASPLRGIAEILVAKNNYGPTQTVQTAYLEKWCAFRNLYRE